MRLTLPSEGGCQYGEIRYRLIGEPVWLTVCHCTECKRQSGGAFGMSLRMHKADVQLINGEPKRWTRPADSSNLVICYFCDTCGNRLWHEPAGSGFLHIKPGTLDDPSQLAPRYIPHRYVIDDSGYCHDHPDRPNDDQGRARLLPAAPAGFGPSEADCPP